MTREDYDAFVELLNERGLRWEIHREVDRQEVNFVGSRHTQYIQGRITTTIEVHDRFGNDIQYVLAGQSGGQALVATPEARQWFADKIDEDFLYIRRHNDGGRFSIERVLYENDVPKPPQYVGLEALEAGYNIE